MQNMLINHIRSFINEIINIIVLCWLYLFKFIVRYYINNFILSIVYIFIVIIKLILFNCKQMKFKFTALTENCELWQHIFIVDSVNDAHKIFIDLFGNIKLGTLHIYTVE